MDTEIDTDRFYLEKATVVLEDDNAEYRYEEVPLDDDFGDQPVDEDLEKAIKTIAEQDQDALSSLVQVIKEKKETLPRASVNQKPEVVDDFVRNFLFRMGMKKTLDSFQNEWYEMQQKGELNTEEIGSVPDIYMSNQTLNSQAKLFRAEAEKYRHAALAMVEEMENIIKERNVHWRRHALVRQERDHYIKIIRWMKEHYSSYEPMLRTMNNKYESAMKQNMLSKLERDRAVGQAQGLQNTLKTMQRVSTGQNGESGTGEYVPEQRGSAVIMVDKNGRGPTQRTLHEAHLKTLPAQEEKVAAYPNDSKWPKDTGQNPKLAKVKGPPGHLTRTGGFRLQSSIIAHTHAVSSIKVHPRKPIIASTSDDQTWKLWAISTGEVIMTGEGHSEWVSDCAFHPAGGKLATTSGDTSTKIWDFTKASCVHTFGEHVQAVWACTWHHGGNFLATCSMDKTAKIWDLNSLRCRLTVRGHADSVNSIEFLEFSNTLLTASADKTVSLWDARDGKCGQTFYGHVNSVNNAVFNMRGDTVASGDSFGIVKLWDVRACKEIASLDMGPHPANKVSFDPSGQVLAVASSDGSIKMYAVNTREVQLLNGHEDAVQCVVFDHQGQSMFSGGTDRTIRVWN